MMNNQEENKWYAIHRPEDPEGDAQIAKNMAYAKEVGALTPYITESGEQYGFSQDQLSGKAPFPEELKPGTQLYLDEFEAAKPEPDEYGIVPKMLPFQGHEFEDNEPPPLSDEPYVHQEPGQPQGSFGMNGVQYKYVNGKWTAMKPDGTPMNDAEMYQHTSQMHQKKPGNVTGRPLLPSRLFQKPTIAQR